MSGKKKLSQQELRKVMNNIKEKKGKKKIESPLAKYNSLGQLTCVICKCIIKDEVVWPIHISSGAHKKNIELAKQELQQTKFKTKQKRPASPSLEGQPVQKIKSILKNSNSSAAPPEKMQLGLPSDFYDKPSTSVTKNIVKNGVVNGKATFSSMPTVSKESSKNEKGEEEKEENKPQEGKEKLTLLPEGFCDDPFLDAKIRNVEYKNPEDEEYERFMKEIKAEEAQANQIMVDEQLEAGAKRKEEIIEEQMEKYLILKEMETLKEVKKTNNKRIEQVIEESKSSDDEDIDEKFVWRGKSIK